MPALSLERVGRSFGARRVLEEVSLDIPAGQTIAVAGPSGSGKSTLLRLLSGALAPSTGVVKVDGHPLAAHSRRALRRYRAACGLVEQGGNLVPGLSVHRNVAAGRLPQWSAVRGLAELLWPFDRARVARLLRRVGLEDRQWDAVDILSGGQQQRVAIARALAGEPTILFADEPTASLDPTTSGDMVALLLEVTRERGATLFFCTHWVSLVTPHVDRLIGIRDGRITLDAPAADVTDDDLSALYAGSRELH